MELPEDKLIILFDGVCNLCNGAVTFIIERDTKDRFRFAALQSPAGKLLVSQYHIDTDKVDSMVLIDPPDYYVRSGAALRIARYLSGGYPLLYTLLVIPGFIRNGVYNWIAKNRYRWFGKKDACMIPTPELQAKFL